VSEDLASLDDVELERRIAEIRERMRPVEQALAELRAARDVLFTEKRRRERLTHRETRAGLKAALKEGKFPTVAQLVAAEDSGSLDDYAYNLKTGGEVRLGFPGARAQTLSFTDGVQAKQAKDLAEAARLYAAGWDLGSPGRPGVRVHFPGTRQERLVTAEEVFARLRDQGA
jgi:nucleoid-associated protein YgaU